MPWAASSVHRSSILIVSCVWRSARLQNSSLTVLVRKSILVFRHECGSTSNCQFRVIYLQSLAYRPCGWFHRTHARFAISAPVPEC